jgi:hypothetical protein
LVAKGEMYYNYYRMFKSRGEEQPGIGVFYKDETGDDTIYDTHSSYARGGDLLIGTSTTSTSRPTAATRSTPATPTGFGTTTNMTTEASSIRVKASM